MSSSREQASRQTPAGAVKAGPIVVAVGPNGGVAALTAARTIASREESDLVVVSVVEPPPVYTFETNRALLLPWLVEQQVSERREQLHDRMHRLGIRSTRGEPEIEVVYGVPSDEIPRLAQARGARLIVMGTGPHGMRHRLLASSTAAATSRRAKCPVLAVGDHSRPLARAAVVATDFSAESIHAARMAMPLLAEGAEVHLVHAWNRLATVFPSAALEAVNDAYAASLPDRFARLLSALEPLDAFEVHTHALEGKPAEIVLAVARAKRADLVVAATHGRGGLQQLLLGSTSAALLRGAECSVLLSPEPPLAERLRLDRHMVGTSTSRAPTEWNEELQTFIRRNRGRRTKLEIDDPSLGAQVQETGYALVGAAYDAHDERVELMFGGMHTGEAHLTHSLRDVDSISIQCDATEQDSALLIKSGKSNALLTFLGTSDAALSAIT
ncbi:MAG TPA: universal stress protein [Gemmatimonadaceae bacterium]|nr:universal stress protein [Gemmatimonadaceae bacterium]